MSDERCPGAAASTTPLLSELPLEPNVRGLFNNLAHDSRILSAGRGYQVKQQFENERLVLQRVLEEKIQEQIGALCNMHIFEVLPPPPHWC